MNFVRKIANSSILENVISIPESLRNKRVEILIFPYEHESFEVETPQESRSARGLLNKYKNAELRHLEDIAWSRAVEDKYENS